MAMALVATLVFSFLLNSANVKGQQKINRVEGVSWTFYSIFLVPFARFYPIPVRAFPRSQQTDGRMAE